MKITVQLIVSEDYDTHSFELSDLGVTEQEWAEMSEQKKEALLNNAVCELPSQPYWMVDKFREN